MLGLKLNHVSKRGHWHVYWCYILNSHIQSSQLWWRFKMQRRKRLFVLCSCLWNLLHLKHVLGKYILSSTLTMPNMQFINITRNHKHNYLFCFESLNHSWILRLLFHWWTSTWRLWLKPFYDMSLHQLIGVSITFSSISCKIHIGHGSHW